MMWHRSLQTTLVLTINAAGLERNSTSTSQTHAGMRCSCDQAGIGPGSCCCTAPLGLAAACRHTGQRPLIVEQLAAGSWQCQYRGITSVTVLTCTVISLHMSEGSVTGTPGGSGVCVTSMRSTAYTLPPASTACRQKKVAHRHTRNLAIKIDARYSAATRLQDTLLALELCYRNLLS